MLVQYLHIELDNVNIKFNSIIKDIINQIKQPNLSLSSKYNLYRKIYSFKQRYDYNKNFSEIDLISINNFIKILNQLFLMMIKTVVFIIKEICQIINIKSYWIFYQ